jgi:aminopeptidase N
MMADFVRHHANSAASTDDFFAVMNAHVGQTALARKFGYKDLNWFYRQWVLQAYLPTYRLTYELEDQADGNVLVKGTLAQGGIPDAEHWFMPTGTTLQTTLLRDRLYLRLNVFHGQR